MHALRAAHQRVIKEMINVARGVLPTRALHLARLLFPVVVVRFGFVVVIARLGLPARRDQRIECPVGQIHALHRVGHRLRFKFVRSPPKLAVPIANRLSCFDLADLKGQHALRPNHIVGFVVINDGGCAAELAGLGLLGGIEHADGLTGIALDHALGERPAACFALNVSERGGEVVLHDIARLHARHRLGRGWHRRFGAAKSANQLLFGCVPHGFAAASDARIFAAGSLFRGSGAGVGGGLAAHSRDSGGT